MAQYKYSVGDRVRVLRNYADETLFDGAVIKVHTDRSVDVVYDKSGNIGVSLTAAEHILQLLGEDGNPKEKPTIVKKVKVRV